MHSKIVIETDRLILRKWETDDLEPFAQLNADSRVMEFFPTQLTEDEARSMLKLIEEKFEKHGFCFWATELKTTQEFIGFVGLNIPAFEAHFTPCVEIGWRLAYPHWGKGYAPEAALASLRYGFETLGLNEIVSFTTVRNLKSRSRLVQDQIFTPLNMTESIVEGLTLDRPISLAMGLLPFQFLIGSERVLPLPHWNYSLIQGAGAIVSTSRDLMKWNRYLSDRSQVDSSWAKTYFDSGKTRKNPNDGPNGKDFSYSFGWEKSNAQNAANKVEPIFWHSGWDIGYCSFVIRVPSKDAVVVFLSNTDRNILSRGAWLNKVQEEIKTAVIN